MVSSAGRFIITGEQHIAHDAVMCFVQKGNAVVSSTICYNGEAALFVAVGRRFAMLAEKVLVGWSKLAQKLADKPGKNIIIDAEQAIENILQRGNFV